jgi:LCP family protein required for cell wall assembly
MPPVVPQAPPIGYESPAAHHAPTFDAPQADPGSRSQRMPAPNSRRAAGGQPSGPQRIPGQANQVPQPPAGQSTMSQAALRRADTARRMRPRQSQPPADRLPQQPPPSQQSGAWQAQPGTAPPRPTDTGSLPHPGLAASARQQTNGQQTNGQQTNGRQGTGRQPINGRQQPGGQPVNGQQNGRQPGGRQGTGRIARSMPAADPAIISRLSPAAETNVTAPGPSSRPGMTPVGPGSRPGFPPLGPASRTDIAPVGPASRPGFAPIGPSSRTDIAPVGPASRAGMTPVGPPSRSGMSPVGRLAATALAVPAKAPAPPQPQQPRRTEDASAAVTAITPMIPVAPPAGEPPIGLGQDRQDGPELREDIDPSCLTSEMEPISEAVEQKRTIDATLARFSAVHDEMAAEEAQRRSRRVRLMPWLGRDADLEEALTSDGPVSPATANEPRPPDEQRGPIRKVPFAQLPTAIKTSGGRSLTSAKMAAAGVAVLVLLGSFFGWRALHGDSSGGGGQIEVAALDENSPAILESSKQGGDSNFLLVGTADRPGNAASTAATDTVLIVHIPVDGSRAAVVSFPPSLRVDRPVCQRWDNKAEQAAGQVPAASGVTLSSVYATGGPRCVTDTVQQLSGLRINHFVGVDNSGFGSLVGGVQGVPVCVAAPVRDAKLGTIVGRSGQVTLSGTQALNYVSADQVAGDKQPADLSRIARQQRFLAAALRKTIGQQNLLMNAHLLNDFLGTFSKATFADNMGVAQLAKLATSLQGLPLGRITFVTVPTSVTGGTETVQATTSKQLFNAVIDNSPLPGETGTAKPTTPSQPSQPVAAKDVKVQVINGTQIPNAAGDTADSLRSFGFGISQIGGPAPPNLTKTVIRYASAQAAQAQLVASSVPSASLQVDPSMDGAIQVIIGPGFNGHVNAPHAGGASTATTVSEAPTGLTYLNAASTSCA